MWAVKVKKKPINVTTFEVFYDEQTTMILKIIIFWKKYDSNENMVIMNMLMKQSLKHKSIMLLLFLTLS